MDNQRATINALRAEKEVRNLEFRSVWWKCKMKFKTEYGSSEKCAPETRRMSSDFYFYFLCVGRKKNCDQKITRKQCTPHTAHRTLHTHWYESKIFYSEFSTAIGHTSTHCETFEDRSFRLLFYIFCVDFICIAYCDGNSFCLIHVFYML